MKETMDNEKLNQIEIGIYHLILDGTTPLGGAMIIDREASSDERLVLLNGKSAMAYIQRYCNIVEAVLKSLKLPRTAGANEVKTRLDTLLEPTEKPDFWVRCVNCSYIHKTAFSAGTISCPVCHKGWCRQFKPSKVEEVEEVECLCGWRGKNYHPTDDTFSCPACESSLKDYPPKKVELVWAHCGNCGDAREIGRTRMEKGAPPCCLNCMHQMEISTRDTILLSHANCSDCGWVSQTSKSRMHPATHGTGTYKCPECGKLVAG